MRNSAINAQARSAMAFQISEATEADFDAIFELVQEAFFAHSAVTNLFYPQGHTPPSRAISKEGMRKACFATPGSVSHVLRDPALGAGPEAIIAHSRWIVQCAPRPRSEWAKPAVFPDDMGEGANRPAMVAFFSGVRNGRGQAVKGRPHIGLNMLATRPRHERRGAGRTLLEYGLERLQRREGLDVYVESTDTAIGLYLRHGFEVFRDWEYDMRPYGGKGVYPHPFLWRPFDERSRRRGAIANEDEGQ